MNLDRRWQQHTPLDWIEIRIRLLWAVALPLAAGTQATLDTPVVVIILLWQGVVAGSYLAGPPNSRRAPFNAVLWMIEVIFGVLLIHLSGGLTSPLWWSLLIGGVSASLSLEFWMLPLLTGFAALTAGLDGWIQRGSQLMELNLIGFYVLVISLAAWWMYLLAQNIRRKVSFREKQLILENHTTVSEDWEELEAALQSSTTILSNLDLQQVYQKTLETTTQTLRTGMLQDPQLQAGLFSYEPGWLRLEAASGIRLKDDQTALRLEEGQLDSALATGEIARAQGVLFDPELSRLKFRERIGEILYVPLLADREPQGLLVYAHPGYGYFQSDRIGRLDLVRPQIAIALRNARLYRRLQLELERITEIQEEARKKLARDLHDGPTQTVAAIAMRLNFARRLMTRDLAKAADEMRKVEEIARSTTREIRHMLFTLRPLILESQGLEAALSELAYKLAETRTQQVLIDSDPETTKGLEMGVQAVLFFIAEEAINNACKHAEAEHIWVRMGGEEEGLFKLEIKDDGVGFNVGSVDSDYERRGSLGMVNMRERTELINGNLHIESAEGQGTLISVTVPMDAPAPDIGSRLSKAAAQSVPTSSPNPSGSRS